MKWAIYYGMKLWNYFYTEGTILLDSDYNGRSDADHLCFVSLTSSWQIWNIIDFVQV